MVIESIGLHAYPDAVGPYADIAAMVRLAHFYSNEVESLDAVIPVSMSLDNEQLIAIVEKSNIEFEEIFRLFYPAR